MDEIIKDFLDTVKNKDNRKNLKIGKDIKNVIKIAVDLAYGDVQRTLKGIDQESKNKTIENLKEKFKIYFDSTAPENADNFNTEHEKLCNIWMNNILPENLRTYGRAQKIVNMTFKYLYCNDNLRKDKSEHFKYCHMPLDRFTLNWFYRKTGIYILTWSHLECNLYYKIQDKISKIKFKNFSVLQTEFKIWQKEKDNFFDLSELHDIIQDDIIDEINNI